MEFLLFLVFVQVVLVGFAVLMARRLELLSLDNLFFNQPLARSECRDRFHGRGEGGGGGFRGGRRFIGLLLSAKAEETEAAGRQGIDIVRSASVGFLFGGVSRIGILNRRRHGIRDSAAGGGLACAQVGSTPLLGVARVV